MDTKALFKLSYGMYVVSSFSGEKKNGQIANTVFQVTSEPAQIAVCINKQNYTHEILSAGKKLSISVLSENAPMIFIGRFGFRSGRDGDKFEGVNFRTGGNGCPVVLENAVAFIEAEVVSTADAGTHTMFIARISDCGIISQEEPMTYAYYHAVKGGKSPKTAPTYIEEKK